MIFEKKDLLRSEFKDIVAKKEKSKKTNTNKKTNIF